MTIDTPRSGPPSGGATPQGGGQSAADAAGRLARDGREAIRHEASAVTERFKEEAAERGEVLKDNAGESLHVFADAIRAASEELSARQPGAVADMVGQAAGGLEELSRSLHNRSAAEMLDSVREFGRRNPSAFIAGSVLAGFALVRLAAPASAATGPGAPGRRAGGGGEP